MDFTRDELRQQILAAMKQRGWNMKSLQRAIQEKTGEKFSYDKIREFLSRDRTNIPRADTAKLFMDVLGIDNPPNISDYALDEAYALFRPIIARRRLTLEQEKRFLKVLQKRIARELSKTGRVTLSETEAEGILEDAILDGSAGTESTPTPAPTLP